jgi:hypothetical protein
LLGDIGFPINFFGQTHTQLFVNNNGNVTFGTSLSTFTPFGLANTRTVIITPFFADVDTRGGRSGVVQFGQATLPPGAIVGGREAGERVFVVNWINVGYYNQKSDKRNSFQVVVP